MSSFIIEGGKKLSGTIEPQGAKNEALQVISACLLTTQEVTIENIPDASIFDIGRESLIKYSKILREAKTIFANGPAGVFEDPKFAIGTEDIINAIASSKGSLE